MSIFAPVRTPDPFEGAQFNFKPFVCPKINKCGSKLPVLKHDLSTPKLSNQKKISPQIFTSDKVVRKNYHLRNPRKQNIFAKNDPVVGFAFRTNIHNTSSASKRLKSGQSKNSSPRSSRSPINQLISLDQRTITEAVRAPKLQKKSFDSTPNIKTNCKKTPVVPSKLTSHSRELMPRENSRNGIFANHNLKFPNMRQLGSKKTLLQNIVTPKKPSNLNISKDSPSFPKIRSPGGSIPAAFQVQSSQPSTLSSGTLRSFVHMNPKKFHSMQIIFLYDHNLGSVQRKLVRNDWSGVNIQHISIYQKQSQFDLKSMEKLDECHHVFLFLNYVSVLRSKTINTVHDLVRGLGLKLKLIYCTNTQDFEPIFDYKDSDVFTRKERRANEYQLRITTPDLITGSYEIETDEYQQAVEFIEKKIIE